MADVDRQAGAVRYRKPVAATGFAILEDGRRPSADAPLLTVARGTIAAAAVATLNATEVEVIAAPGAGEFIEVISVHWMLDYGTADYDAAGAGEDLVLSYTDAAGAAVVAVVDHSGFGDASADAHAIRKGIDAVPVANAAIVAHLLVGEWYGAAGDSDLVYEIVYIVRKLAIND